MRWILAMLAGWAASHFARRLIVQHRTPADTPATQSQEKSSLLETTDEQGTSTSIEACASNEAKSGSPVVTEHEYDSEKPKFSLRQHPLAIYLFIAICIGLAAWLALPTNNPLTVLPSDFAVDLLAREHGTEYGFIDPVNAFEIQMQESHPADNAVDLTISATSFSPTRKEDLSKTLMNNDALIDIVLGNVAPPTLVGCDSPQGIITCRQDNDELFADTSFSEVSNIPDLSEAGFSLTFHFTGTSGIGFAQTEDQVLVHLPTFPSKISTADVIYEIADAKLYNWQGIQPEFINSETPRWDFLGESLPSSDSLIVVGSNSSSITSNSYRTFAAGALIALASTVLIAALQEWFSSKAFS